jgi:hypothetical protein
VPRDSLARREERGERREERGERRERERERAVSL